MVWGINAAVYRRSLVLRSLKSVTVANRIYRYIYIYIPTRAHEMFELFLLLYGFPKIMVARECGLCLYIHV